MSKIKFKLFVKPEAERDIDDAIYFWENRKKGLGLRLLQTLDSLINEIQLNPLLYQKKYKNIRVAYTSIFQYGIHFIIENNIIYILAVMHTSRNPKK